MPNIDIDEKYPDNQKTVFVLDHTPFFRNSCETETSKSLWTLCAESAIDYCRIVWDLFPEEKLLRFIASDKVAHIFNTWTATDQKLNNIMKGITSIGEPVPMVRIETTVADYNIIHGLRAAVVAMSECSDTQLENSKDVTNEVHINRCRVICITSVRNNKSMEKLQEVFYDLLEHQNDYTLNDSDPEIELSIIDNCHLIIINTFPSYLESPVRNHTIRHFGDELISEVYSIKASLVPGKLFNLLLNHYNLASTTITEIPITDDENASSTTNHNVEIFHASSTHMDMFKYNFVDLAGMRTVKEGMEYKTVTVKWCLTQSLSTSMTQNCTCNHQISPADVNSKPFLYLLNILLNNRLVVLKIATKSGGKMYLKATDSGEIFIHTCTASALSNNVEEGD